MKELFEDYCKYFLLIICGISFIVMNFFEVITMHHNLYLYMVTKDNLLMIYLFFLSLFSFF